MGLVTGMIYGYGLDNRGICYGNFPYIRNNNSNHRMYRGIGRYIGIGIGDGNVIWVWLKYCKVFVTGMLYGFAIIIVTIVLL